MHGTAAFVVVHANKTSSRRGSERCHHRVILQQIGLHNVIWRKEREREREREEKRATRRDTAVGRIEVNAPNRVYKRETAAAAIILNYHRLSGMSHPRGIFWKSHQLTFSILRERRSFESNRFQRFGNERSSKFYRCS